MRKLTARKEDHTINGLNLALAGVLFVSPWLFGFAEHQTASWNAWVSAALVALVAGIALAQLYPWEERLKAFVGLWVAASPWLLRSPGSQRPCGPTSPSGWRSRPSPATASGRCPTRDGRRPFREHPGPGFGPFFTPLKPVLAFLTRLSPRLFGLGGRAPGGVRRLHTHVAQWRMWL
jgi:SPW repeat